MDEVLTLLEGFALMLGTPVYLVLQVWAPLRLRGPVWRAAALLPLLPAIPITAWCLYALGRDSNLWPLPFILFAPLGVLYLAGLLVARRAFRRA